MMNIFKNIKLKKLENKKEQICAEIRRIHLQLVDMKFQAAKYEREGRVELHEFALECIRLDNELLEMYQTEYDEIWNEMCELY